MRFLAFLLTGLLLSGPASAGRSKKTVVVPKVARQEVAPAPEPAAEPAAPVREAAPATALSDDDFQAVLDAVHDAGTVSSNRMSALQLAADGKGFRMEQVGKLVDLFSFSEDKLHVVKLLRSGIVDRGNLTALLAHFSFASDKDAVRKLLGE